jgi:hypothetical protein
MKIFIYILSIVTSMLFASPSVKIESIAKYRINNLNQYNLNNNKINDNLVYVADYMYHLGSKYKPYLLDRESNEYLYLSTSDTDCFIFIEEVLAISLAIKNNQLTQANVLKFIQLLRYGNNVSVSYCNRNHYFKQWLINNQRNGLIQDEGYLLTKQLYPYSVGIISQYIIPNNIIKNKSQYLQCIYQKELAINKGSIGFIPVSQIETNLQYFKNGDIVGIVRDIPKTDKISHLGIIYKDNKNIGMYHASSKYKKVVKEASLLKYLGKYNDLKGIVLVRVLN